MGWILTARSGPVSSRLWPPRGETSTRPSASGRRPSGPRSTFALRWSGWWRRWSRSARSLYPRMRCSPTRRRSTSSPSAFRASSSASTTSGGSPARRCSRPSGRTPTSWRCHCALSSAERLQEARAEADSEVPRCHDADGEPPSPVEGRRRSLETIERWVLRVRVVAVLGGCALTGSLSPREVGSWSAVGILAFGCAAVCLTLRHQPDRHRLRWIGAAATAIDAGGIALLLTTISDLQPANSAWLLTALVVAEAAVRWDLLGGMLAGLGAAVGSALWAWARLGSHANAGEVVGPVAALLVFGMTAGVGMRRLRALAKSMAAQSERLQTALEVSGTVTWDYDIPRDHLVVSENFERLVGLPAADFSAFSDALMRMVLPDDRVGIDAEVARGEFRNEYRLILPGGRVRWMRASGQILTDREGAPIRSVGVATDVTARQTADDARRDAEAVLGTTIDLATYAAIGMDDAGRISEWSPAAEQLFGWTSDEILGRDAGSARADVCPKGWRRAGRRGHGGGQLSRRSHLVRGASTRHRPAEHAPGAPDPTGAPRPTDLPRRSHPADLPTEPGHRSAQPPALDAGSTSHRPRPLHGDQRQPGPVDRRRDTPDHRPAPDRDHPTSGHRGQVRRRRVPHRGRGRGH